MFARGVDCRGFTASIGLALLVSTPVMPARSEDALSTIAIARVPPQPSTYGWREVSGGVDAASDQWLVYSSMTFAPWSANLYSDGWRLRVGGGYGQYSYDAIHTVCGEHAVVIACAHEAGRYTVDHSYAEALLGYYIQLGQLTAKAFAGASMSSQRHDKPEPGNTTDGTEYGAKVALELWLNLSELSWTSLDASYATARNESSARWRFGWRIAPTFSIGPELRYDKNIETGDGDWNGRAGLFTRYEWAWGEVSLAGGFSGRVDEHQAFSDTSPYGTVNVLFQY